MLQAPVHVYVQGLYKRFSKILKLKLKVHSRKQGNSTLAIGIPCMESDWKKNLCMCMYMKLSVRWSRDLCSKIMTYSFVNKHITSYMFVFHCLEKLIYVAKTSTCTYNSYRFLHSRKNHLSVWLDDCVMHMYMCMCIVPCVSPAGCLIDILKL